MNSKYKTPHLALNLDNVVIQDGVFRIKDFSLSDEIDLKSQLFYFDGIKQTPVLL